MKVVEISLWLATRQSDVPRLYATSSSSPHTSKARGLKIGMLNPYMNGSKITNKIFDILPWSWDI